LVSQVTVSPNSDVYAGATGCDRYSAETSRADWSLTRKPSPQSQLLRQPDGLKLADGGTLGDQAVAKA
jgi:hypothetical protein